MSIYYAELRPGDQNKVTVSIRYFRTLSLTLFLITSIVLRSLRGVPLYLRANGLCLLSRLYERFGFVVR